MKPSAALNFHRQAICEAVSRYHTANPRVFGSVLSGNDKEGSDLLVDAFPGATL